MIHINNVIKERKRYHAGSFEFFNQENQSLCWWRSPVRVMVICFEIPCEMAWNSTISTGTIKDVLSILLTTKKRQISSTCEKYWKVMHQFSFFILFYATLQTPKSNHLLAEVTYLFFFVVFPEILETLTRFTIVWNLYW